MNLSVVKLRCVLASLGVAVLTAACGGGGGDSAPMTGGTAGPSYAATNLVSDFGVNSNPYASANVDTHLVNAWGSGANTIRCNAHPCAAARYTLAFSWVIFGWLVHIRRSSNMAQRTEKPWQFPGRFEP